MTPEALLEHWQGHRRLTRRVSEAFPEEHLFSYHAPEMRTFAELMTEILNVETSVFEGLLLGEWAWRPAYENLVSKEDLLSAFAEVDGQRAERFTKLTNEKFQAVETDAWGMTSSNLERLFYVIDNEVHHCAQGYVYLRSLSIEPPAFYER